MKKSEKQLSYEKVRGKSSVMKVSGIDTEFPDWEYVRALEVQDIARQREIEKLKKERDNAIEKLQAIYAEVKK